MLLIPSAETHRDRARIPSRRAADALQVLLGLGVSAVAVHLLLQAVPLDRLIGIVVYAQAWVVGLAAAAVLGSLLARAERWRFCFVPNPRPVRFRSALGTLSISYLVSSIVPLRAGEVVRAVLFGRRESRPVLAAIGSIVLEKWFDFVALVVLFGGLLTAGAVPQVAMIAGMSAIIVAAGGLGVVVGLVVWRDVTLLLLRTFEIRLPWRLARRISLSSRVEQLSAPTDVLRHIQAWARLLVWSAVTWAFALATVWASACAVDVQLGLSAVAVVALVTSVGQAIPSSPGYVGVYHAATVVALSPFGVDPARALGVAVIAHMVSYGTLMLAGLVSLWAGGYGLGDIRSARRLVEESSSDAS